MPTPFVTPAGAAGRRFRDLLTAFAAAVESNDGVGFDIARLARARTKSSK